MTELEQMVAAIQNENETEMALDQQAMEQSQLTTREEESSTSDADVQVTPQNLFDKIGAKPPDEIVKWLKSFVYGEPGVGKTYLGGTAGSSEETSPLLIIDIDGGFLTVRHMSNIMVRQVRTLDELAEVFKDIHSAIDWSNPHDPKLPFKTCMIDSITELQKIDMLGIMKETRAVQEGRQDPYVPSEREWFISQGHMREIIRKFKDLPCHIIFTAHLDAKKNNRNQMVNGPDLPGKLRNQIAGFFDVVGLLYATPEEDGVVRKIQFEKTDTTIAKDRLQVLGQVVVNPTFPMLVEKLHEGVSDE